MSTLFLEFTAYSGPGSAVGPLLYLDANAIVSVGEHCHPGEEEPVAVVIGLSNGQVHLVRPHPWSINPVLRGAEAVSVRIEQAQEAEAEA